MSSMCFLTVVLCLIVVSNGQPHSEKSVRLGNDVTLPCRLTRAELGDPDTVNVRWYSKKESGLTSGTRVYKHRGRLQVDKIPPNEWNLKIKTVAKSFADIYTCTANGKTVSTITLKIQEAPKIITDASTNSEVTFPELSMAEMTCAFTGEPKPEVTWYRGYGSTMTLINITGPVLRIRNTTRYATDVYTCRGKNSYNHYDHRIKVTVTFEPEIHVMEDKVYANLSEIPVLSCMIEGTPIRKAHWKDNKGNRIRGSQWNRQVYEEIVPGSPVRFLRLLLRQGQWGKRAYGTYTCIAEGKRTTVKKFVQFIDKAEMPITLI